MFHGARRGSARRWPAATRKPDASGDSGHRGTRAADARGHRADAEQPSPLEPPHRVIARRRRSRDDGAHESAARRGAPCLDATRARHPRRGCGGIRGSRLTVGPAGADRFSGSTRCSPDAFSSTGTRLAGDTVIDVTGSRCPIRHITVDAGRRCARCRPHGVAAASDHGCSEHSGLAVAAGAGRSAARLDADASVSLGLSGRSGDAGSPAVSGRSARSGRSGRSGRSDRGDSRVSTRVSEPDVGDPADTDHRRPSRPGRGFSARSECRSRGVGCLRILPPSAAGAGHRASVLPAGGEARGACPARRARIPQPGRILPRPQCARARRAR